MQGTGVFYMSMLLTDDIAPPGVTGISSRNLTIFYMYEKFPGRKIYPTKSKLYILKC